MEIQVSHYICGPEETSLIMVWLYEYHGPTIKPTNTWNNLDSPVWYNQPESEHTHHISQTCLNPNLVVCTPIRPHTVRIWLVGECLCSEILWRRTMIQNELNASIYVISPRLKKGSWQNIQFWSLICTVFERAKSHWIWDIEPKENSWGSAAYYIPIPCAMMPTISNSVSWRAE